MSKKTQANAALGDSESYEVTAPINLAQLVEEIKDRVGKGVKVNAFLKCEDIDQIASKERPALLFVSPASLDGRTVRAVINTHVPTAHVPVVPVAPALIDATPVASAAMDKLRAGKTLTTAEISAVLGALIPS